MDNIKKIMGLISSSFLRADYRMNEFRKERSRGRYHAVRSRTLDRLILNLFAPFQALRHRPKYTKANLGPPIGNAGYGRPIWKEGLFYICAVLAAPNYFRLPTPRSRQLPGGESCKSTRSKAAEGSRGD